MPAQDVIANQVNRLRMGLRGSGCLRPLYLWLTAQTVKVRSASHQQVHQNGSGQGRSRYHDTAFWSQSTYFGTGLQLVSSLLPTNSSITPPATLALHSLLIRSVVDQENHVN